MVASLFMGVYCFIGEVRFDSIPKEFDASNEEIGVSNNTMHSALIRFDWFKTQATWLFPIGSWVSANVTTK